MDYPARIKSPIKSELERFDALFAKAFEHSDGLLSQALSYIARRTGKRMRPALIMLIAKNYGTVDETTLNAAVALELLHTVSLVHDDVVDESDMRRGQASVNASFGNKVAVLVGDYLLSTALLSIARTESITMIRCLADLGHTLAAGEILQLSTIKSNGLSEDIYFDIIKQKTAALFEACCTIGALSGGAADDEIEAAKQFGRNIGMMFQVRDDIFDYFPSTGIGKPTGNDMAEGKLTLPAIYAVNNSNDETVKNVADKVKARTANVDEIGFLVDYTKANGGIEYAERQMRRFQEAALQYIESHVADEGIKDALRAYADCVVNRKE